MARVKAAQRRRIGGKP